MRRHRARRASRRETGAVLLGEPAVIHVAEVDEVPLPVGGVRQLLASKLGDVPGARCSSAPVGEQDDASARGKRVLGRTRAPARLVSREGRQPGLDHRLDPTEVVGTEPIEELIAERETRPVGGFGSRLSGGRDAPVALAYELETALESVLDEAEVRAARHVHIWTDVAPSGDPERQPIGPGAQLERLLLLGRTEPATDLALGDPQLTPVGGVPDRGDRRVGLSCCHCRSRRTL